LRATTQPADQHAAHSQNIDGINFLFIKKNNIYFVVTTKFNVSPSFTIELLERVAKVFKDYCGVLSEESIRKNFVLLYELLDEMIVSVRRDGNVGQSSSTCSGADGAVRQALVPQACADGMLTSPRPRPRPRRTTATRRAPARSS
jgi:hypothetical protein